MPTEVLVANADPTPVTPVAQPSLRRRALSGSIWTLAGFGTSQLIRLGSNIVLAALLFQEAFALMAIVGAIVQGLAMFSDIGLGPSIVQNKRGDERDFLDTAWTLQVIRGTALSCIAALLAWPLAAFYAANDPMAWELRWLIPLVALGSFVEGFQSMKLKTASRHMKLARLTLIELSCLVVSTACMIAVAWATRSVYALAVGGLVSMTLHCLLSYVALPGAGNRLRLDLTAVREIVHLGKWVFLSTIITFFALQLDRLMFARLFPLDQVGVYAIAASLAMLTPLLMGKVQAAVAFPLYARLLDQQENLDVIVRRTKLPMLALGGYLVALSIACAQTFIDIAYDHRYAAAGLYIAILAGGAWFAIIDGIYGAALLASGRAQWVAAVNGTKVISFCLLMLPGVYFGGLLGAVVAVAASDAIKLAVGLAGARAIGLRDRASEFGFSFYTAAAGIGVLMIAKELHRLVAMPNAALLVIEFALVTAAFSPALYIVARSTLKQRQ